MAQDALHNQRAYVKKGAYGKKVDYGRWHVEIIVLPRNDFMRPSSGGQVRAVAATHLPQ